MGKGAWRRANRPVRRRWIAATMLFVVAGVARGVPLKQVNVSAPDINCRFDVDCTITVNDSAAYFTLPSTVGDAVLQTRTWPVGEASTVGAGLYAYLYRLDLRKLAATTAMVCVSKLVLAIGAVISPLDYDADGTPEDVFVVTGGGVGSIAPASTHLNGRTLTVNFNPSVCPGASPGKGESSYFFGLASTRGPRLQAAVIVDTLGGAVQPDSRVPGHIFALAAAWLWLIPVVLILIGVTLWMFRRRGR